MKFSFALAALCCALVGGGCTENALQNQEPLGAPPQRGTRDSCVAADQRCDLHGLDCCAGFCMLTGYVTGTCVDPQPDGASCTDDAQCATGHCEDYVCGAKAVCRGAGTTCESSAECCEGTCEENYYLETWHTCVAPLPNGSYCHEAPQCASGQCRDYLCVPTSCAEVGSACEVDGDCCAGAFCENFSYAAWGCQAALPDGSFCHVDAQCVSRHCLGYVCEPS